jgi:hypothetical protein
VLFIAQQHADSNHDSTNSEALDDSTIPCAKARTTSTMREEDYNPSTQPPGRVVEVKVCPRISKDLSRWWLAVKIGCTSRAILRASTNLGETK